MAEEVEHDLVLMEVKDNYAVITLNRAEKRNAASRPLQRRLREVLDEAEEARVRVIVITGAGDKSFCAGVDLRDESPTSRSSVAHSSSWLDTQNHISRHPAVFIAAVNGFALGGGLTLVNNCDLAIASDAASFGAPEITFGVYAAFAGPSTVRRVLPKHVAQLLLVGDRIDADTAYRWGLVNEVVPAADLMRRAEELAQKISGYDEYALQVAKDAIRAEEMMDWDTAMDHGTRANPFLSSLKLTNGE